jgi:hypothetical protein
MFSGKVAAKLRDGGEVEIEIAGLGGFCCNSVAVEQRQLGLGEDGGGGTGRFGSARHGHPEYPPCRDAGQRDAIGQPIGGGEADIFDPAASLQRFEEGLDTPPPHIPFQFMDSLLERGHFEIGDQLPEQWSPMIGRVDLGRVDDLKLLMFIPFLLSDRWGVVAKLLPRRIHIANPCG